MKSYLNLQKHTIEQILQNSPRTFRRKVDWSDSKKQHTATTQQD